MYQNYYASPIKDPTIYNDNTNANNSNQITQNLTGQVNNNKITKKVKFDDKNIHIINVESYKEHNRKFCYNPEEDEEDLFNDRGYGGGYGYNDYYYKKYAEKFNQTPVQKEQESKCCCIIL